MHHQERPITPTQEGANGAMDIFVEGARGKDVPQMLFGLSVLRSSTEAQVNDAMRYVEAKGSATVVEIEAMFAEVDPPSGAPRPGYKA